MRHVMVDIETLGVKPGSVILSIGACRFDESGVGERFYRPIDVFDSLMAGLAVDPATVGFWRMQPAEAREALRAVQPLRHVLETFAQFVAPRAEIAGGLAPLLWAKGPDFDLVMLESAFTAVGMKKPWSYRVARDVRTMLALAPGVEQRINNDGLKHHALGDAEYQARLMIGAAAQVGFPLSEMA